MSAARTAVAREPKPTTLKPRDPMRAVRRSTLIQRTDSGDSPCWVRALDFQDFPTSVKPTLERNLDSLSSEIRTKRDWCRKVFDPAIVAKWRAEASEQEISEQEFDVVLQELQWMVSRRDPASGATPSPVNGAWISDDVIPPRIAAGFIARLQSMEDAAGVDFHPKSQNQVRNYVHPSVYCAKYGRTVVLYDGPKDKLEDVPPSTSVPPTSAPDRRAPPAKRLRGKKSSANSGLCSICAVPVEEFADSKAPLARRQFRVSDGTETPAQHQAASPTFVLPIRTLRGPEGGARVPLTSAGLSIAHPALAVLVADPPQTRTSRYRLPPAPASQDYQWIPAEYHVDISGRVRIQSYICGVDPALYPGLYAGFEAVFQRMVPLLERTLGDLRWAECEWVKEAHRRKLGIVPEPAPAKRQRVEQDDESQHSEFYRSSKIVVHDTRVLRLRSGRVTGDIRVRPLDKYEPPLVGTPPSLKGATLQVITKAARVYLNPGETYGGGTWHVEGMDNESILATCICYLEQVNISDSYLEFRRAVDTDIEVHSRTDQNGGREGHAVEFISRVYGVSHEEVMDNYCGKVATPEGRCLCFPNTMQHRVSPFQLLDPTKPGWRTIVVYFVVDPRRENISSAIVPPQDRDWQTRDLVRLLRHVFGGNADVASDVASFIVCGPSKAEAMQWRLEFMEERSMPSRGDFTSVMQNYSMCEH